MEKTFDAAHLDVAAFAQAAAQLQGQTPLAQWPRLAEEQVCGDAQIAQDGQSASVHTVQWRLQGQMWPVSGAAPRVALHVWACADMTLQCQRCLTPVPQTVQAQQTFVFVADEATAAALDEESEEDVLVLSRDCDALGLIEDELILAMPLVPQHAVCPVSLPLQAVDEGFEQASERPHPFAALASMKKNA